MEQNSTTKEQGNSKINLLKKKFNTLTVEQKLNYVAIPILVIVFGGIAFWLFISNDKKNENAVTDFTTPQSEQIKYNNKLEAINSEKNDDNISLEQFGNTPTDDNVSENDQIAIDQLTRNINGSSNPSSDMTYSTPKSTNSHNVYGDYDMWQSKEPANSQIGYSKKSVPTTNQNSVSSSVPKFEKVETQSSSVSPVQSPTYSERLQERGNLDGQQIRAKIISQGKITNGRSLSFVMLEPAKIGNVNTKKGQVITGVAKEQDGRLLVNFSAIKIDKKFVQANIVLLGFDGQAGLPIAGENANESNSLGTNTKSRAAQEINRIPIVGGIISSSLGSKKADNSITIPQNMECVLMIY